MVKLYFVVMSVIMIASGEKLRADDFSVGTSGLSTGYFNAPGFSRFSTSLSGFMPEGFGLQLGVLRNPDILVGDALRNTLNLHPLYQIKKYNDETTWLTTTQYHIYTSDFPVCNADAKVMSLRNGESLISGHVPRADPKRFLAEEFPRRSEAVKYLLNKLTAVLSEPVVTVEFIRSSACLFQIGQILKPVLYIIVKVNELPYTGYATEDQVYLLGPGSLTATAVANIFSPNINAASKTAFQITVDGSGYLQNDYFTTIPSGTDRLKGTSFDQDKTDPKYGELASYVIANMEFDYAKSLGYNWIAATPMNIKNHTVFANNVVNNAQYLPAEMNADGKPAIYVGDGDGRVLKNLGTDNDVVSHEFGHHIVYNTLKTITAQSESLILHEGLADYFTYARKGNACLGESICPDGSSACVDPGKCLRKGTIPASQLSLNNTAYNSYGPHGKGQLINGYLWDLQTSGAMGTDLPKLTLQSLSLYQRDSGIQDFMLALFKTDCVNYNSKYGSKMLELAKPRGLDTYVSTIKIGDCASIATPSGTGVASSSTSGDSSKKGWFGCGMIDKNATGKSGDPWGIFGIVVWFVALYLQKKIFFEKKLSPRNLKLSYARIKNRR